ncbi:Nedd4 interacting protein [Xylographa parallela]|nr:Nedd4 interacting protein [Xylographa parallela]
MGAQRYEKLAGNDAETPSTVTQSYGSQPIPSSPPPSFRSRASSPSSQPLITQDHGTSDEERTLADTFDDGQASDDEGDNEGDDRQRLMRRASTIQEANLINAGTVSQTLATSGGQANSTVVNNPAPSVRAAPSGTAYATFSSSNDGVFANLDAKPEHGEKTEDQPPSYEQAAADATPPYWETTILTPGMVSDEVYVDGLPVGSLFSFVWNGIISMSFQLVGFLLTYLLHTTHAAKNGSRAGLGITLVNYGFVMKSSASSRRGNADQQYGQPPDPNSHDFDPSTVSDSAAAAVASMANSQGAQGAAAGRAVFASEWIAYTLMIVGWFILIKSVTDFIKARRHEQLVLQSPDRGLNVPVVAEGEPVETAV